MNNICVDAYPLINEIMINPSESDTTHEWIELYNPDNKSYNLSHWTLEDNTYIDSLEPDQEMGNGSMVLLPHQYGLITDKDTELYHHITLPENVLYLTVDDQSIGNGLGNTQDQIILKNHTDHIIDSLEWGENVIDIPGQPAPTTQEGHSLIRLSTDDKNSTLLDFKETTTITPGATNIFSSLGKITIPYAPTYIAKAYDDESFSMPISIQIHLENFTTSPYYEMKVAVIANTTNDVVTSQTWDQDHWHYSDRYLFNITTDETGSYSQWVHLRFNTEYKSYSNYIINQDSAFLQVKIREQNKVTEFQKEIQLLDMDSSTSNGTMGGYAVYQPIETDHHPTYNTRFLLVDQTGEIMSIYSSENNTIDEGYTPKDGFLKLTAPTGSNYSLCVLDENQLIDEIKKGIEIIPGRYQTKLIVDQSSFVCKPNKQVIIPVTIENTGDFNDTIRLVINTISSGWVAKPSQETITLSPGEQKEMFLTVRTSSLFRHHQNPGDLELLAQSTTDLDSRDSDWFYIELIAPDLTIPNMKIYDDDGVEISQIPQGRNIKIKAYCKNSGNENASDVTVFFFYDSVDETHLIGSKNYDTIGKYQKYPSMILDTGRLEPGVHQIFTIVDYNQTIREIDEYNNKKYVEITIINTSPTIDEKQLLITEFYYHTHPGIYNEYIQIFNPTNTSIDLTGIYLTNTPERNYVDQWILRFPIHTVIKPDHHLILTQDAQFFLNETGFLPDFEYKHDSVESVPQMIGPESFTLGNSGGWIALKNAYNHTIDYVCYGNRNHTFYPHWIGETIPLGSPAQIWKRTSDGHEYVDTNTRQDFHHPRYFFIGQSDLHPLVFQGSCSFELFVSPDSSYQAISCCLEQAKSSVLVNMYEFTNLHLCNVLIDCLRRNISITLLMEGSPVGGISAEEWYLLHRLHTHGAQIFFIMQNESENRYARYPFNHAKYVVIDNQTSIIESCNWAETGVPVHPSFGNREWGIIIQHPRFSQYLSYVFHLDCNMSRPDICSYADINIPSFQGYYKDARIIYGPYEPQFEMKRINTTASITPVFSPDTSQDLIRSLIQSADSSICIQQLYIYRNWTNGPNPFLSDLIIKAKQGVNIRVIMNYNPFYEETINRCNQTKSFLENQGITVRFIYTNQSGFTNIHNKGVIIDNQTVLISSINWNENSVMRNREVGVIIDSKEVAEYYSKVFYYDWNSYKTSSEEDQDQSRKPIPLMPQNSIYIISVFSLTFIVIARDWRTRKWE